MTRDTPTGPLVVFDLDGTLLDTLGVVRSVLNELAPEFGFRTITPERFERLRRMSIPQIIRHLRIRRRDVPEIARRTRAGVHARRAEARVFPGVEAALLALSAQGVRLGVLSSNRAALAQQMLSAQVLERLEFIDGDAGLEDKAERLGAILARTGAARHELLYVGDELRDVAAARAVGVDAAAVSWGANHPDVLADALPAVMVPRPEVLAEAIGRHLDFVGARGAPLDAAACWRQATAHLKGISRTFSVAIRVLPPASRRVATLTYLLMRALDCVEDHFETAPATRAALLRELAHALEVRALDEAHLQALAACGESEAHRDLLQDTGRLVRLLDGLPAAHGGAAARSTVTMALGMAMWVEANGDAVFIESPERYNEYVYYVSGAVGEFLTELFAETLSLDEDTAERLEANNEAFARALKAANDLQDVWVDAVRGPGSPIPNAFFREAGTDVRALAEPRDAQAQSRALAAFAETVAADLEGAARYVACLPKRHVRERAFLMLALVQARETLRILDGGVPAGARQGAPIAPSKGQVLRIAIRRGPATLLSNRMMTRYLT